MQIDVIETFEQFDAVRDNWAAVYAADPEGHFLVAWQWISDSLRKYPGRWLILAARPDGAKSDYVGFFPLRLRTLFDKKSGFHNELLVAGQKYSDYTGFICLPDHEEEAIAGFARQIKNNVNWARLSLDNLRMSEKRRKLLLSAFDKTRFVHRDTPVFDKKHNLNQDICPLISLPDEWDAYLETLSSNNRQKVRRFLRKVEGSEQFRITVSDADTIERDLETMLEFWRVKWAPRKGNVGPIIRRNAVMLRTCFENGDLFMPVFWHGDRPIAALAIMTDKVKKAYLFWITGRDETYEEMPSGFVLHAFAIRHAIANGYKTYDFLRGNEPYKYLFAPQEHHIKSVLVTTATKHNLGGKLDARTIPDVIDKIDEFKRKKNFADAERGYRQVLEVDPDHAVALFGLGRLMAGKDAHLAAIKAFSRIVELKPDADKVWFAMGDSHKALGDRESALAAYRKVVEIHPGDQQAVNLIWELEQSAPVARKPVAAAGWAVRGGAPGAGAPSVDLGQIWNELAAHGRLSGPAGATPGPLDLKIRPALKP